LNPARQQLRIHTTRREPFRHGAGNESDRVFCSAGAHIPFNATRITFVVGWEFFSKASPLH